MKTNIILNTRGTSDLSEVERYTIASLCTEAHQIDFSPLFSYLPPDGLYFLAYVQDRLASHAMVTARWLQPGHLPPLKTGYVDAVATLPVYQGQGIGSIPPPIGPGQPTDGRIRRSHLVMER